MNVRRELKILRDTEIEGIVESFEKEVEYNKRYILLAYLGFAFIFSSVFSKNFSGAVSNTLLFLGIIAFISFIFVLFKTSKEIDYSWHPFAPHVLLHPVLGLSIFVGAGISATALFILYTSKYGHIIFLNIESFILWALVFAAMGLIPFLAIIGERMILKSQNDPVYLLKIFKGPYNRDDVVRIRKKLSEQCKTIEKLKWGDVYMFNCLNFKIRFVHHTNINLKGYNILIEIENLNENNAPSVKRVIEKIENLIQSDSLAPPL